MKRSSSKFHYGSLPYIFTRRYIILQLILIGLLLPQNLRSQSETKLYVTVLPNTTLMKINGYTIALTSKREVHMMGLKPGLCPIELWAPGYKTIKDTINILEGTRNKYAKLLLEKTPEFEEYERLDVAYTKQVRSRRWKKFSLISGGAFFSYFVVDSERFRIQKYRKRADLAWNNYKSATVPSLLEVEYNNYQDAQENHNKAVRSSRNRLKIGIPLAILASMGAWLQIKKINKKKLPEKPVFQSGPPFTQSGAKVKFESYGSITDVGLRITF